MRNPLTYIQYNYIINMKDRKEYMKQYYLDTKDGSKRKDGKDKPSDSEYMKQYYLDTKDGSKRKDGYVSVSNFDRKQYYLDNRTEHLEKKKQYYLDNRELIIKKMSNSVMKRRKNDPIFKLHCAIGSAIRTSIKNKGYTKKSRTHEILGCSYEEFSKYLESKFEPWMTWDNKGKYNGELNYGWDMDHIIPVSSAITEEELIRLNYYTNFQPLCSKVNRDIKKDKLNNGN